MQSRTRTESGEEMTDPMCSSTSPQILKFEDITSASFKIKTGIMITPCLKSHLSQVTGMEVYLKKDFLQYTGSFKERGARYALLMLSDEKKKKGVISASLGNHALALCYHGKDLKIPVTVVMPIVAPIMKIQSCRQHGASVVVQGDDMGEAKRIAMQLAKERELTYINGFISWAQIRPLPPTFSSSSKTAANDSSSSFSELSENAISLLH